ncbi:MULTISPECIES: chorismate mutase [unclassified Streptomyces]|uniref:chorismate mutase n=1 Tax=unclassified Streptomyces TaxID=2593676 RepID=UPI00383018AE
MKQSSPRPGSARPSRSVRPWLAASAAALALLGGPGAAAATAAPAPVGSYDGLGSYNGLLPVAELSAQRLAIADLVAAAKWGTAGPIDDPAREQQVLDTVARQADELGADPAATVRIFRDQIEANKDVQRALHRRWDADPAKAPTEKPDLAVVRVEINRVNDSLVRAIADSAQERSASHCEGTLLLSAARVRNEEHLDLVHTAALGRSLRSVCAA